MELLSVCGQAAMTASAHRMPSAAAERMPPAYPAPLPQGNRPRREAWRLASRQMRTGDELLVSGPVRTASGWSKPGSFRPKKEALCEGVSEDGRQHPPEVPGYNAGR